MIIKFLLVKKNEESTEKINRLLFEKQDNKKKSLMFQE